jgi:hypothetical protein
MLDILRLSKGLQGSIVASSGVGMIGTDRPGYVIARIQRTHIMEACYAQLDNVRRTIFEQQCREALYEVPLRKGFLGILGLS